MVKEFLPLHGKKGLLFPVLRGSGSCALHCFATGLRPPLRPGLGFLARKGSRGIFYGDKKCKKLYNSPMPERNKSTQAIILSVKQQGENNRSACIVSPDRGVFYATLYGGSKSKMRSLVQPFNAGLIYLYEDEARHFIKISDFDVKSCHVSLHTDIYKMMAANLASELLIKTKCAGEYSSAFTLFSAFLEGLERTQGFASRTGTIRFLWRYLKLLGQQPDANTCSSCSTPISTQTSSGGTYIRYINGFVCSDCAPVYRESQNFSKQDSPFLSSESLFYLNAVNTLRPSTVRTMELSPQSESELKTFLFMLIEQAVGSRLNSLETGSGIL